MLKGFSLRRKRPRADRLDRLEAVEIDDGTGAAVRSGFLKDISETGALIHIEKARTLPSRIRLTVPALDVVTEAEVRWTKDDDVGVRFFKKIDMARLPRRERKDRREIVAAHFRPKSPSGRARTARTEMRDR